MEQHKVMMVVDPTMLETVIAEIGALKSMLQTRHVKSYSDDWVSGKEVMEMLGISSKTLQNYRDRRVIPFSKIGKKIYYNKKEIDKLLNNKQIKF
jgi:hypothetical protein